MPSFDHLRAFTLTAQLGSFSAAARQLGKTVSTVSEAIATLEIDCNLSLFDRSGKKPTLTVAGQALLERADAVLAAYQRFTEYADASAAGLETQLTLACSDGMPVTRLPGLLSTIDRRFPDLTVEVLLPADNDIIELVASQRAQLGLLMARMHYPVGIEHDTLGAVSLSAFIHEHHPLVQQTCVRLDDLRRVRELCVAPRAGSSVPVAVSMQRWLTESYWAAMKMAEQGLGWTALPRALVEAYASPLRELALLDVPAHWHSTVDVIWRSARLGQATAWLIAALRGASSS